MRICLVIRRQGGKICSLHGTFPPSSASCGGGWGNVSWSAPLPRGWVVSFFLQQSVLLAGSMEFPPRLSWQLLIQVANQAVQRQQQLAGREEEEGEGGPPHSALTPQYPYISSLSPLTPPITSIPGASQKSLVRPCLGPGLQGSSSIPQGLGHSTI